MISDDLVCWADVVGVGDELAGVVELSSAEEVDDCSPPSSPDAVVELSATDVGAAAAELGASVLLSTLLELLLIVSTLTLHKAWTPWPIRKTPTILVSGTSTPAQALFIEFEVWTSPSMQDLEQVFPLPKSEAEQEGMGEV